MTIKKNDKVETESDKDGESNDSDSFSETCSETDSGESLDAFDIIPATFFSVKELCYYKLINKFFSTCSSENITQMINIVEGKSDMSLRVLDWFVTKYSKKRIDCGQTKDEMFDVRISYKSQLKSYKKKYFDPFRRKKKFNYYFKNGQAMKTTLGQLNFFKWAFINNIVMYVEKNLKQVIKEMKSSNKESEKKIKKKEIKKKNVESTEDKVEKTKKVKKSPEFENTSTNIKINTINNNKLIKDGEIQLTLVFD